MKERTLPQPIAQIIAQFDVGDCEGIPYEDIVLVAQLLFIEVITMPEAKKLLQARKEYYEEISH